MDNTVLPKDTRYMRRNGEVTERFRESLERVLTEYVPTVVFWSERTGKPLSDYRIREAHVVGSILEGNDESDVDIMLIANHMDEEDYRFIKVVMAKLFYSNRIKTEAVDVFVRQYDAFPERNSFEITNQVKPLLDRFNSKLVGK